jgi:hypothetical protein
MPMYIPKMIYRKVKKMEKWPSLALAPIGWM